MTFKTAINILLDGHHLDREEAYGLMRQLGEGAFDEIQNTALIIALSNRDPSLDEIMGFRDALLDLSISTPLTAYTSIDMCGTGGDEKNTFNISTIASFIVAAAGYPVVKHGNYGVSSVSGSSNVMEHLGYRFSTDASKTERELNQFNICFLHAPLFHPALKNVSGIRKQLGFKTIFNTLGPLVNPARPKKQLVGVYNLKIARLYHYLLQQSMQEYVVVHTVDGYDEISLTGDFQILSFQGEKLLSPADLGMGTIRDEDLFGGHSVEDAASIFKRVIDHKGTQAQTNVVIANAGVAIQCFEKNKTLTDCIAIAREALANGNTATLLQKLMNHQ